MAESHHDLDRLVLHAAVRAIQRRADLEAVRSISQLPQSGGCVEWRESEAFCPAFVRHGADVVFVAKPCAAGYLSAALTRKMSSDNPILNNPYGEPKLHYATNPEGELDYESVVEGRRLFTGTAQAIPVRQREQRSLLEINQVVAASHGEHLVHVLRREVRTWREGGYQNTTRVTRELLHFWFKNEEDRSEGGRLARHQAHPQQIQRRLAAARHERRSAPLLPAEAGRPHCGG